MYTICVCVCVCLVVKQDLYFYIYCLKSKSEEILWCAMVDENQTKTSYMNCDIRHLSYDINIFFFWLLLISL